MAFFCPGSSVKIKKEVESPKRPYPSDRHNHSPHPPHYPNPSHNDRANLSQEVSAPQPPISNQFLQKLIVLQEHSAGRDTELNTRKGERIEVVRREGDWLYVRNEKGKEGYVPSNKCVPPVVATSRRRNNSRSSIPLRMVGSSEVGGSHGNIPMFSTNSAGQLKRYDSPVETEHALTRRVSSPGASILSTMMTAADDDDTITGSTATLTADSKDPMGSGLIRVYSDGYPMNTTISATQPSGGGGDVISNAAASFQTSLAQLTHEIHRTSSDGSSTIDILKDNMMVGQNETSSEEGSRGRGSAMSGVVTPSNQNRPLPTLPIEDVPPPIPPRSDSLHRSTKPIRLTPDDDVDPYATPVDTLKQPTSHKQLDKTRVKSLVDIGYKDTGVDSPYSEVYRSKDRSLKRKVGSNSGGSGRQPHRSTSFTKRRSPNSGTTTTTRAMERMNSPGNTNGFHSTPPPPPPEQDIIVKDTTSLSNNRSITKFRKCFWGVFVCTQV
jgi:hypothetical protein